MNCSNVVTDLLGARVRATAKGAGWTVNSVQMVSCEGRVVAMTAEFGLLVRCDDNVLRMVFPMSHDVEVIHSAGVVP